MTEGRLEKVVRKALNRMAPKLFPKFCPNCFAERVGDGPVIEECAECWYERRCENGGGGRRHGWPGA